MLILIILIIIILIVTILWLWRLNFKKSVKIGYLKDENKRYNRESDSLNVCHSEYGDLINKSIKKEEKIKELMNSVQSLNRDLDEWVEAENLAKVISPGVYPRLSPTSE